MDRQVIDLQIELLRRMLAKAAPDIVFGPRAEAQAARARRTRIAAELERLEALRRAQDEHGRAG